MAGEGQNVQRGKRGSARQELILRMGIILVLVLCAFVAVALRSFTLMTVKRDSLMQYAYKETTVEIPARRGDILAANGVPLATSVPFYDIFVDMRENHMHDTIFYRGVDSLALCLANLFGDKDKASYKALLNRSRDKNNGHLLIHRRATYNELMVMKGFPIFRRGRPRGGYIVEERSERVRPLGDIGARVIGGCYRNNGEGHSGLELYFNEQLKGVPGEALVQRASGSTIKSTVLEPEDGVTLLTTIDVELQDALSSSLMKHMIYQRADKGCAILMEVETGDIKAISNLSKVGDGIYAENENMAVEGLGEPGSVMKAATSIAFFEDGLLAPNDTVRLGGKGYYVFGGKRITDSEGHEGMDAVSVKDMFKYSLNGISLVANNFYGKEPAKLIDHWYDMKLNERTGITLKGEPRPDIKHPNDSTWDRHFNNLPWMSIGYSVTLTPMQLCAFYNAIANGGQRMKPRLVKEIHRGEEVLEYIPIEEVGSKMYGAQTREYMDTLLLAVVEDEGGTGRRIKSKNYKIAGKTGTAHISQGRAGYANGKRCTFAGYFPADDPKYTCVVVIDFPRVNRSGAAVSAPGFKEIADRAVAIMAREIEMVNNDDMVIATLPATKNGYADDLEKVCNEFDIEINHVSDGEWVKVAESKEGNALNFEHLTLKEGLVPNVVGMGVRDAVYLIENAGMRCSVSGVGRVYSQSIPSGSRVVKGREVQLRLR